MEYRTRTRINCIRSPYKLVHLTINGEKIVTTDKPKSVAVKSKAYDIVKAAVDTKVGKFTKKEIANICPSISEKSVEAALRKLVDEQYIERHGTGKNSFYAKVSS